MGLATARMIPSTPDLDTPASEKHVFEVLRDHLLASSSVFHSRRFVTPATQTRGAPGIPPERPGVADSQPDAINLTQRTRFSLLNGLMSTLYKIVSIWRFRLVGSEHYSGDSG